MSTHTHTLTHCVSPPTQREPLGSVLTRYTSALTPALRRKARFLFDGSKVNPTHTPLDLDMEDGDVVEVWF